MRSCVIQYLLILLETLNFTKALHKVLIFCEWRWLQGYETNENNAMNEQKKIRRFKLQIKIHLNYIPPSFAVFM